MNVDMFQFLFTFIITSTVLYKLIKLLYLLFLISIIFKVNSIAAYQSMQRPPTNRSIKINEDIHNEILPRNEKLKKMENMNQIPKTTEDQVIVNCLNKTFGFKTNQYSKNFKYLDSVINKKQFNQFIRNANRIIEEETIKKNTKENQPFFSVISVLLKICIVIAIFTFILMAFIVYVDIQQSISNTIMIIATILLACSSVFAGVCPIILYTSKYVAHNYQQLMKERLDELAIRQNRKNFQSNIKHLLWKFQKNFFWIQLNINRINLDNQMRKQEQTYIIHFSGLKQEQNYKQNDKCSSNSNEQNQQCQSQELQSIEEQSQSNLKKQKGRYSTQM